MPPLRRRTYLKMMESGKVLKLANEINSLMGEYHDSFISFETRGQKTVIVKRLEENAYREIFEIRFDGPVIDNFTIYESVTEDDQLSYRLADNDEPADIFNCQFELIDVFTSFGCLLFFGAKVIDGKYGNWIVLKFSDVDAVITR